MLIEISKEELIALIQRYDILTYSELLGSYGNYYGQTNKTYWKNENFDVLSEEQLYGLYIKLKAYEPYDYYEGQKTQREKEIEEIQSILDQGVLRGSKAQVEAAKVEIDRLRSLPL